MELDEALKVHDDIKSHFSPRAQLAVEELMRTGAELTDFLKTGLPDSRETDLALARVQEGLMWASTSITKNLA